ncbi:MAG TPA: type 4a pilus biogenesis protein PilO [Tepidisphaeraceae bacterium]|nr:type 4a pilus biogenesis protein PilO [Tepidisphaeraceae bacterium]
MQFGLRTVLYVVLVLGMLVMSYPLLFKPLNEQRAQAVADTKLKQQKLADLASAMRATQNMPEEITQLKKAIEFLTSKLPAQTEMDKVLDEVWKAAKENKLTVKSVRNGKPIEGPNYNEQPIRMVVEGPFHPAFYKFLSQVEQMPRLTKIKEMKIEPDHDEKKNGVIVADFELTIYYESNQNVAVAQ